MSHAKAVCKYEFIYNVLDVIKEQAIFKYKNFCEE